MIHLVRDTQGEDGEGLGAVSDFSHIPAPSEATWVGEWRFFKGCCPEHQDWLRYFGGRSWTVEFFCDHVEVEIAGAQFSDGSTDRWICVDGDYHSPSADEALMLAATLSSAADELQRIESQPYDQGRHLQCNRLPQRYFANGVHRQECGYSALGEAGKGAGAALFSTQSAPLLACCLVSLALSK